MHTYIHTYIDAYIHYLHTYVLTYIHSYITYTHTHTHTHTELSPARAAVTRAPCCCSIYELHDTTEVANRKGCTSVATFKVVVYKYDIPRSMSIWNTWHAYTLPQSVWHLKRISKHSSNSKLKVIKHGSKRTKSLARLHLSKNLNELVQWTRSPNDTAWTVM